MYTVFLKQVHPYDFHDNDVKEEIKYVKKVTTKHHNHWTIDVTVDKNNITPRY